MFMRSFSRKKSKKSPGQEHKIYLAMYDSSMDAKTSGWKFDEKQDIYRVSKYLPRCLLITKEK